MGDTSTILALNLSARSRSTARMKVASYFPSMTPFARAVLLEIEPDFQAGVAVIVVHGHAFAFQIRKSVNAFAAHQIIFPPGVVALADVHVGVAVERLARVKVVMVAGNDIEIARL